MFSIYGVKGPVFRGVIEDFRRVSRTLGVAKTRPLDPVLDHMLDVARSTVAPPSAAPTGGGMPLRQHAHREYARTQQSRQPERRPLSVVADVMSAPALAVRDTDTLREAWAYLQSAGVGQAPVVDAEGLMVGMVTRADLVKLEQLPSPEQSHLVWLAVLAKPVAEFMTSPVPAVHPNTDIRRLAQVLLETDYPGLPVMADDDALVGFVTRTDILKAIATEPPLDLWSCGGQAPIKTP
ncbi:MAG: CBS domain-containing protein [Burkholderiaceae bacterium]|nr:CBS domain-containing protein [Burkholderiaceae bacterium]